MQSAEINLQEIKERNTRVELDKAWEVSSTRKVFILVLTYVVALAWLILIHEPNAALKALVPVAGYFLSTLTLPPLKKWWINKQKV